jgi:ribose-phosphate pyrophosphokinase
MEKVVLMADPHSKAWDFATKMQVYLNTTKGINIPLREVSINHFRNGEIDMHVPENVRKKDVYFVHDSSKNPQEWWVELLLIKDLLLSASAQSVSLVLPNMLYSRKDRKEKPHVPISARALASSLSSGISRIITMDLHADQVQGFYPSNIPLDNLHSFPEAVNFLKKNSLFDSPENLVILSPDAGGVNRARAFAQALGSKNPIAFIYKRRDKPGEVSEMILVGDVANKDVLIVDDLIDSGGTLCSAAGLLKKQGARKLYCYGTHGLFTQGTEQLKSWFDILMSSNTNYREGNDVKIVDVSPVFAEAVYRAQIGQSISELFKVKE